VPHIFDSSAAQDSVLELRICDSSVEALIVSVSQFFGYCPVAYSDSQKAVVFEVEYSLFQVAENSEQAQFVLVYRSSECLA
jgi:hypothetical protein